MTAALSFWWGRYSADEEPAIDGLGSNAFVWNASALSAPEQTAFDAWQSAHGA